MLLLLLDLLLGWVFALHPLDGGTLDLLKLILSLVLKRNLQG